MTCAHHCLISQILLVLDALPDDVVLRLRRARLPEGILGDVDFEAVEIRISDTADLPEARSTLAHELAHLHRGPARVSQADAEETIVEEIAARLLVPRDHLPAILDAADPHRVAAELAVDLHTARLAIALARADEQAVTSEGAA